MSNILNFQDKKQEIEKQASEIKIKLDGKNINLDFQMADETDWIRAAWLLINICEANGQLEELDAMLEAESPEILTTE